MQTRPLTLSCPHSFCSQTWLRPVFLPSPDVNENRKGWMGEPVPSCNILVFWLLAGDTPVQFSALSIRNSSVSPKKFLIKTFLKFVQSYKWVFLLTNLGVLRWKNVFKNSQLNPFISSLKENNSILPRILAKYLFIFVSKLSWLKRL